VFGHESAIGQGRFYSQKRSLKATTKGVLAPGLAFTLRPRSDDFALPARIRIAEAAEPGDDRHAALLKSAVLAVFGNIAAEIAEGTPGPFVRACRAWLRELNGGED